MSSYFPDISHMPVRDTILQLETEDMKMHCLVMAVTQLGRGGAVVDECGAMVD
jgi:hypothetical protein